MNGKDEQAADKSELAHRIELILNNLLSPASLTRIKNIKLIDLARYYRVEQIIIDKYSAGATKIEEEELLEILKETEDKKNKIIYNRRGGFLDLEDD